jgi:uncharacterized membrane protein
MMGRKLLKKEAADKGDFLPLLMMAGKGMAKMQKVQQQNVVSFCYFFVICISTCLQACMGMCAATRCCSRQQNVVYNRALRASLHFTQGS